MTHLLPSNEAFLGSVQEEKPLQGKAPGYISKARGKRIHVVSFWALCLGLSTHLAPSETREFQANPKAKAVQNSLIKASGPAATPTNSNFGKISKVVIRPKINEANADT